MKINRNGAMRLAGYENNQAWIQKDVEQSPAGLR